MAGGFQASIGKVDSCWSNDSITTIEGGAFHSFSRGDSSAGFESKICSTTNILRSIIDSSACLVGPCVV